MLESPELWVSESVNSENELLVESLERCYFILKKQIKPFFKIYEFLLYSKSSIKLNNPYIIHIMN